MTPRRAPRGKKIRYGSRLVRSFTELVYPCRCDGGSRIQNQICTAGVVQERHRFVDSRAVLDRDGWLSYILCGMISVVDGFMGGKRLAKEIHEVFSESGLLSKSPDFEYRKEQQEMAVAVADALDEHRVLVAEAGTGVGKSLAYLIPSVKHALESGRKAIISTHTINLQEQLMGKDIPIVKKLLGVDFDAVLMKGRGNYLCPARLRRAMDQTGDLFTTSENEELNAIWEWAEETEDGSLSDLDFQPSMKVWSQVCSEPHICTQKFCGARGNCFYQRIRKQVEKADVLVVNHTLFFALLDSEGDGDNEKGYIFPNDFVVFDEAHTMEHVAATQLGLRVSHNSLKFDVQRLYNKRTRKGLLRTLNSADGIKAAEEVLFAAEDFFDEIEHAAQFGDFSNEFRVREPELVENTLAEPLRELWTSVEAAAERLEKESTTRAELMDGAQRLRETHACVRMFLDQHDEDSVYWVQRGGKEKDIMSLHSAPIDVAERLRALMFGEGRTCVLTSATLSTGEEDLGYFRSRVGADDATAVKIGSPFDYKKQMQIYVMKSMPDPKAKEYEDALVHWISRALKYTEGKAFVLFTSFRVMRSVADKMEEYFDEHGWQLLVQGSGMPRHKMVEEFRNDIHSVLFGLDSFWAGVDVPGESLSNVIVTRLPFAVPDHPLVASKLERIEEEGGNPFVEYSVPEAVLKLRQGVGRLIRSEKDSGMVVILDNRVVTKPYGKSFLKALPDAPIKVVK